jgi:hypothetical protein
MAQAVLERTTTGGGTPDPVPKMTTPAERTSEPREALGELWDERFAAATGEHAAAVQEKVLELLRRQSDAIPVSLLPTATEDRLLDTYFQLLRQKMAATLAQLMEQITSEQAKQEELLSHAAAARGLREMTGQPDAKLGPALGVSRVSFSRWATGGPISSMHRSRLFYVHTLAKDAIRRLGKDEFQSWLVTPIDVRAGEAAVPLDLLERGWYDDVHRLIVELPDPEPIVDGEHVALRRRILEHDD